MIISLLNRYVPTFRERERERERTTVSVITTGKIIGIECYRVCPSPIADCYDIILL